MSGNYSEVFSKKDENCKVKISNKEDVLYKSILIFLLP